MRLSVQVLIASFKMGFACLYLFMALHSLTIERISGCMGLLLSHSWWQNSEELGEEGMP